MASTSTPATVLLRREKVAHRVHEYEHDPRAASFGAEAVEELGARLGVLPDQIFKTLVVSLTDGSLAVAVIPVPATLSLKAVAGALGGGKATMAERAAAERATGYVLGGISPLGQRKHLRTVVDASAERWDRMLCSAGRRGLEIDLDPRDLIRLTDAVVAPITAGR
ncbi:Cys-tRNA(Pro) deacylase [Rhodococcus sp. CH91]|uniref:Cys-tRNA(Pro) deacylase n=1 Tax=Rhodococcus sp. CH91 TaxID=2910256 RepID=UPI001F4B8259|nr:Cys-tRNA(Pro) deacylase [Rhodococcus sp. CH91]